MRTKQFAMWLLCAAAILSPLSAGAAFDTSGTVYTMRSSDGLDEDVLVDGRITFVSQTGSTIPSYKDTGTNFKPANEGEVLKITVDNIDLTGGNYLLVYEQPITQVRGGTSDGVDQSRYLPTGWLYKLTAEDNGFTYQSGADHGGLSFGFHSGSPGGQKGFSVTIESVALKDMEYVSTETVTDFSVPYRGAKDAVIAGVGVKTDGGLNPLTLNSLVLDCSALGGDDAKVSNLRLYASANVSDENLVATAGADGKLSLAERTLKSGVNKFYVVADIAPDATGNAGAIEISEVTVDNVSRTPASASVATADIANEIRMSAENRVYTIGTAAAFYDDGGKDGKIAENFTGSVTFVPATAGNAIKVDVTRLAVFNTSSTGYNDVFSFYNGREATADNLITTLLKQPRVVKSTAADGSMTVTLTSTTGVPADGWEALVSEYTPGNMVLSGVTATAADSSATVSAMQKDVELLGFDIVTDNVSNPLSLEKVSLASTRPEVFKAISLYAVDNSDETPVRTKITTFAPTGSPFVMEAAKELIEGHNGFVITAELAENLLSGDKVNLSLNAVTVSGTEHTAEAAKELDVLNIWKSVPGTSAVTVNGSWGFTHTTNSLYSNKYEGGLTDEITTFRPANAGNVIQLDFESFAVYYASYSSGTRATFEIYSGDSCNPDNLLWKADSSDKASNGPGATLRSSAADGSMTIRFNPQATSSYYLAAGWNATVKEFRNHDMTITSATASLPTDAELAVGASGQPLLNFVLTTEGTLTVKTLKKINLALENARALSAVEIYVSTQADGSSAVLFGKTENPGAATAVSGEYELREGANYFFVKIDVSESAAPETTVSAALVSAEDAQGNTDTFENCAPEGGRVIKDMLLCEPGEHTVTIAGAKMFYDDGGKDGNISSRISAVYTFIPAQEGYAVTLNSSEFSIGNGRMYIYNGRSADENNRLGTITGYSTTNGPKQLVSKAADGSLTMVITGPSGTTLKGFAIEVGLHERVSYTLADATASSAAPAAQAVRGSSNLPLLDVKTTVEGDKDASEMSAFRFSLAGTTSLTDIKSLRLYYAGTSTVFAPTQAELLATVENPAAEEIVFETARTIGDNGDYHFFLAADLSADAAEGNIVKAAFTGLSFNGSAHTAGATSAAAEVTLSRGISGTFTIGASDQADYATFAAATAALAAGVEGPVVFEIESGTYRENLIVSNVAGTSAENTVTFRSKSGSRGDVIISGAYTSAQKEGIVRIVATPFVTVANLSVAAGAASFDNAVYVGQGSYNVTLENLDVTADKVTSGYTGINLLRTYSSTSIPGQFNDNLTVRDCHFAGGRIGLYLASNGIVAWPQDRSYRILHNTLEGIGNKAVYANDVHDLTFCDNIILEPSPVKSYYATDFYRVKGAIISGNRIVNGSENTNIDTNGLYFRTQCGASETMPMRVFNNEVVMVNSPSYGCRALQIGNDCSNMEIAYNTFRATGKSVYLFATSGNFTPAGNSLVNNIFHSECTDAVPYAVYFWNNTDIQGYAFTGNVFYSAGGYICKNDSEVLDAEGFNTLVGNETSIYEQTQFLGVTDSHPAAAGSLNAGTPLDYVTTDRDGNERSATAPTIGAYEFTTVSYEAPVLYEGYPVVGTPTENSVAVSTKWDASVTLYVKITAADAEAPAAEELLAGNGAEVAADSEYATNFTGLTPSTSYRAWFLAVSAVGVSSEIAATDVFTTARHIEPLRVALDEEPLTVAYGESTVLTPYVSGGDEPYTYVWKGQNGEILGNEGTLSLTPETPARYTLSVTSADGQKASATTDVEVSGAPMAVATFDDNYLESESHIMPEGDGHFYSGTYRFNYGGMPELNFWYGYTLSNETSAEFSGLDDQFHSACGGGFKSANFAVGYPQGMTIEPVGAAEGTVIPGFYVNNSAYAFTSMTDGDGIAKAFAQGDWFKLSARITAADGTVSNSDLLYLADFREENEAEHYILTDWEYVDLSRFGAVKAITFLFDSSDRGTYGVNTPTYLCIDNFGSTPDAETVAQSVDDQGLDLRNFFDIADNGSRTDFAVSQLSGHEQLKVRLDGHKLYLDQVSNSLLREVPSATALVSMRQKGHTRYLNMTLTRKENTGVENIGSGTAVVSVALVARNLYVNTSLTDYTVDIYSTDGRQMFHSAGNSGNTVVDCEALMPGVHFVSVRSAAGSSSHRILVK